SQGNRSGTQENLMHKRGWLLAAALAVAGTVRADVVHLHSGATLEGDLKKTAEGWVLTLENGAEMQLPAEQVKRVELKRRDTGRPDSEAIARSRLTSLNRSVEALTDAQAAVDRYEAFIEQFAATPAADAARRELARWKQRVAEGQ